MSIKINEVTKKYGDQKALDSVSFEVNSGEVLGFLGPNGAGKSTLMKIITCYLPPTSGDVLVNGFSVRNQAGEVKKIVGYLPESNPLYYDMYVKEYLAFIAHLHKIPNRKKRVSDIIGDVGLGLEHHKKIGALSKGYKQRVGIAQALIHDPQILILDEPTSGLDPNQLVDIRQLIINIGKEKTVMLSTHIMQEVEAICDRIVIINRGSIVANNYSAELMNEKSHEQRVLVEFDHILGMEDLKKEFHNCQIDKISETEFRFTTSRTDDIRKEISRYAQANEVLILSMKKEERKLEDIFKILTQK